MDRIQPWQILGLKAHEEEFCRLRIAHPELSNTAIVRLIPAYASRSAGGKVNAAHKLHRDPKIQQRLRQLERDAIRDLEKRKRVKLSGKRVLRELSSLAFSDIRSLLEVEGNDVRVRDSSDWPDSVASAVQSVVKTTEGVKVTLHEKLAALRSLAKILKLLPEETQAHPGGLQIGRAVIYLPDNGRPLLRDEQRAFEFVSDPEPPAPEEETQ